MKVKLWLMAVVMCVMPVVASAGTKWYILEMQNYTCHSSINAAISSGLPALMSPLAMRDWLRTQKGYYGYKVYSNGNGTGRSVLLSMRNGDGYVYFSNKAQCEKIAHGLRIGSQGLNQLK